MLKGVYTPLEAFVELPCHTGTFQCTLACCFSPGESIHICGENTWTCPCYFVIHIANVHSSFIVVMLLKLRPLPNFCIVPIIDSRINDIDYVADTILILNVERYQRYHTERFQKTRYCCCQLCTTRVAVIVS